MDDEYSPHFEALLNAAVDGIIVIDKLGTIRIVNPAVTKLFGYDRNEIIGQNVKMLMPDSDGLNHDKYIETYLETGEARIIGIGRQTTGQRKDKSPFPIYLSVGQLENNEAHEFVGIIRDLTAQRQQELEAEEHELEIRKLQERLIHVARISTLGEMVTGIAHEVNQPLTAISTYAQACIRMINSDLENPRELLEAQEKISSQAQRAAKIITRIRDFARKSPVEHQPHNCNALILEVVALAGIHAVEMDIAITLELAEDTSMVVMVDAIQVQQVVLNLINNAIESMADTSGKKIVTIGTQVLDEETIEVSVSDNGDGLVEAHEEQIFDAFFSTKSAGLGIGLSICKSLIAAHRGKIGFSRNQHRGCTFYFTLPTVVGTSR